MSGWKSSPVLGSRGTESGVSKSLSDRSKQRHIRLKEINYRDPSPTAINSLLKVSKSNRERLKGHFSFFES